MTLGLHEENALCQLRRPTAAADRGELHQRSVTPAPGGNTRLANRPRLRAAIIQGFDLLDGQRHANPLGETACRYLARRPETYDGDITLDVSMHGQLLSLIGPAFRAG